MSSDTQRSEQVIEDYKKHKLASSALRRIHAIIRSFDEDHAANLRLARVGLVIVVVLIAVASYFLLNTESVTLP